MPKTSLNIFALSPLKVGDEVEFLAEDKHKSFLQDGRITLGVISQAGPKYQKLSLQYLKENMKDEAGFLPADKC